MLLAVLLGAFGAHVVEEQLTPERFDIYQTAMHFQFYHALGLLATALAMYHLDHTWLTRCGWLLTAGIVIFSGSLYLLVLADASWLGAVTPVGGVALIAGWICFVVAVRRSSSNG